MELAQRIGPVARIDLCEEYRNLAATAIRHRHRHASKLAEMQPEDLSDGQLAETVRRLKAWLADRPALPVAPDSYLARQKAVGDEAGA